MELFNFIIHFDQYLPRFIENYGVWVYAILFMIIFVETGVVLMPFLPGDNLLFVAGAMAAVGSLNPWLVGWLLVLAAVLGDSCNYWIGRKYGLRLFSEKRSFPSMSYLRQSEAFFAKHGGKSVMIGRFFPFIRTFTPFVAGISIMPYPRFLAFSVAGSLLWVGSLVTLGYQLGQVPWIRDNLTVLVFVIIGISLLPVFYQSVSMLIQNRKAKINQQSL